MRSSKSRSRSKQNRPRTLGNIINRVFDSSGPEGKVRGTPQQIIEKYQLLARDAQLSNDRVAAENFLQHAEHYTRLLAEAQREMAAEQDARQQFHQPAGNGNGNVQRDRNDRGDRPDYRGDQPSDGGAYASAADGFDVMGSEDDAGLVDLPEAPRPQNQQPRRDDNRRDDRSRNQRRDDRPREERPREERPREERPRDDRPRDERPREERPREERPREDRARAPEAQAELPSFITGTPAEPVAAAAKPAPAAPAAEPAPKPARAPRAKKPAEPKPAPETPEAAE